MLGSVKIFINNFIIHAYKRNKTIYEQHNLILTTLEPKPETEN